MVVKCSRPEQHKWYSNSRHAHIMKRKKKTVMVFIGLTAHKQDHDIWRWKSKSWFRTCCGIKPVDEIPPLDTLISNGSTYINKR